MVFTLVLENKICMKSTTSALFLTWLQWPRAVGTSPATGGFPKATSPAWQGSPAAGRCLPPAAQQQAQSRGTSRASSMPPWPPTQFCPTWQYYFNSQRWAANLGLYWVQRGEGHSPEVKQELCFCSWIFWSSGSSWGMELCEGQDTLFKLGLNPSITLALCSGVSEVSKQDSSTPDLWLTTSDWHKDHKQATYGHINLPLVKQKTQPSLIINPIPPFFNENQSLKTWYIPGMKARGTHQWPDRFS